MPWRGLTAVYAGAVFLVSVLPIEVPGGPELGLDKFAHVVEYAILAWLLHRTVRAARSSQGRTALRVWSLATAYGLLLELIQGVLPWRSAQVSDAVMNGLGAALGVIAGKRGLTPLGSDPS